MIFKIISVVALILSIYSVWGIHQNTETLGSIHKVIDEFRKLFEQMNDK